jgi:SpoIID/LytB domain protein
VVDKVRFEPLDGTTFSVAGVGEYRGALEVVPSGRGVAVVNELGLDDYLHGVSEVPVQWPAEVQKAQAIAARTYALWQIARHPVSADADICPTQSCQVYSGLAKENRPGAAAWTAAVDATAGQVLWWRGGPILAKYSSTNGGRSVAGGYPYLRSVADPDDAVSPYHHWEITVPLTTIAELFPLAGRLTSVARAGDAVAIGWQADDGSTGEQAIPVEDFRAKLNGAVAAPAGLPLAVPSVRFSLSPTETAVIIDGQGWGHGVGLSQYGALGKALRGMRAPDILASYYGGLRPVVVPAQQLPSRIRVLLDSGRAAAKVSGTGRFRVVDGAGRVIGLVANGAWQVSPGGGRRVRVVAPADQSHPPGVVGLRVEPSTPHPGQPVQLHFGLAGPAALKVTYQPPGATAPTTVDLGLRDAGAQSIPLPASSSIGPGVVTVVADAGLGRTSTVPLGFSVTAAPFRAPTPRLAAVDGVVGRGPGAVWFDAAAVLLLLAASAGLLRMRRQLH